MDRGRGCFIDTCHRVSPFLWGCDGQPGQRARSQSPQAFSTPFTPSLAREALLCLLVPLEAAWATNQVAFTFENEDIQTVTKKVDEFAGTTFLFGPKQANGRPCPFLVCSLAPGAYRPRLRFLHSARLLAHYADQPFADAVEDGEGDAQDERAVGVHARRDEA